MSFLFHLQLALTAFLSPFTVAISVERRTAGARGYEPMARVPKMSHVDHGYPNIFLILLPKHLLCILKNMCLYKHTSDCI